MGYKSCNQHFGGPPMYHPHLSHGYSTTMILIIIHDLRVRHFLFTPMCPHSQSVTRLYDGRAGLYAIGERLYGSRARLYGGRVGYMAEELVIWRKSWLYGGRVGYMAELHSYMMQ